MRKFYNLLSVTSAMFVLAAFAFLVMFVDVDPTMSANYWEGDNVYICYLEAMVFLGVLTFISGLSYTKVRWGKNNASKQMTLVITPFLTGFSAFMAAGCSRYGALEAKQASDTFAAARGYICEVSSYAIIVLSIIQLVLITNCIIKKREIEADTVKPFVNKKFVAVSYVLDTMIVFTVCIRHIINVDYNTGIFVLLLGLFAVYILGEFIKRRKVINTLITYIYMVIFVVMGLYGFTDEFLVFNMVCAIIIGLIGLATVMGLITLQKSNNQ